MARYVQHTLATSLLAFSLSFVVSPTRVLAQQATDTSDADVDASTVEMVIVTGTRDATRTQFDTLTPIDVISAETIDVSVSSELVDTLAQIVPSFNVQRLPSGDGPTFVRPARLRGLSPDQTLVLINGKRMHRSAMLGSRGAQAPDLAQLASSAVKRIEVLRDGASAQYGSDAIAGVINIILDDFVGFGASSKYSQYYQGDGANSQFGVRGGWAIGDGGHVTATVEYSDSDETSRTRQRPDAIAFQQAHPELDVPNPVQHWGQPKLEVYRAAIDAALPLASDNEAYAFGTYSQGEGVNDFNWRNPDNTASAYAPSSAFPEFDLRNLYPTGYSPRFGQDHEDHQLNVGARGPLGETFRWDLHAAHGSNEIDYFIYNTINPSLGPQSPTSFKPGTLIQDEFNLNADFVYRWDVGALADDVNVAFGAERRVETYEIKAGDFASYAVGPGAATGLASGSNGFAGFNPDQAGEWDQRSYAFYSDIEVPLTSRWTLGVAARYEDFSEFGDKITGRFATRLELTTAVALRASASTGFRAPTPGQLFSTSVSQGLDVRTLQIFATGRLAPTTPVAQFFGAKALQPETSDTFSAGLTWQLDTGLSGSFDVYQVDVSDRFSQSSTFTVTPAIRQQLIAAGVPGAETFTGVSFFTNDFDTRTRGIDLATSYSWRLPSGRLQLTASYNFNDTEVTSGALANSESQRVVFEEGIPQHNAAAGATYSWGPFKLVGRVRYYGQWTDSSGNTTGDIFQEFGALTLVDAMFGYDITPNVSVAVGAENVFDEYPDEATNQANRGLIYSRNAPYDTDGGQYYLRLDTRF
jgi:iron complex outermembrane receptor protein